MKRSTRWRRGGAAGALTALVVLVAVACASDGDRGGQEPAGEPDAGSDEVTVVGVLTDEGVECPALRGDDGELYTLTGESVGDFVVGQRVRVTGRLTPISICMQGTTIAVSAIEPIVEE